MDFFLAHHSEKNIRQDIKKDLVFLYFDISEKPVGTVTIRNNEICRLFVLPSYQGKGYGTELLNFAERRIFKEYSKVILDASLPGKSLYLKRGYRDTEFHTILTGNNDFLCYDVMEKRI